MEHAFHFQKHWGNASDLRREISRFLKHRPTTFKNGLSPRGYRCSHAMQPSGNRLIRQRDTLFLKHGRRSYESVKENDLYSQLLVVLLKGWLGRAGHFQEMELFRSTLDCQHSQRTGSMTALFPGKFQEHSLDSFQTRR